MPATIRSSLAALLFLLLASASLAQTPPDGPPKDKERKLSPTAQLLVDLAREHPQLDTFLRGGRYPEALSYLDGLAATPAVHMARIFVLAGMRRYGEALKEARTFDGPEPETALQFVAYSALHELAKRSAAEEERAGIVEVGLEAATAAIEARKDFKEAMFIKSRLLRQKAELATGPQRAALLEEASELARQAESIP